MNRKIKIMCDGEQIDTLIEDLAYKYSVDEEEIKQDLESYEIGVAVRFYESDNTLRVIFDSNFNGLTLTRLSYDELVAISKNPLKVFEECYDSRDLIRYYLYDPCSDISVYGSGWYDQDFLTEYLGEEEYPEFISDQEYENITEAEYTPLSD